MLLALLALLACTGPPATIDTGGEVSPGALALDPCDPGGFSLGELELGEVASVTVRANNLGGTPVTIESASIAAPYATTATTPTDIAPGSSTQFAVRLVPDGYGDFFGTLDVVWHAPGADGTASCAFVARVPSDRDEDGFDGLDAAGDDCDDTNATVFPGAEDAWYDGVDSDCDERSDYDQDGDGFDSSAFDDDPLTGGDCQDTNPGMHPGAPEAWYDGVDSDCDGADDFDRDGDGWGSALFGGGDCDDADAEAWPEAEESWNGADDDCNGAIDDHVSARLAPAALRGLTNERFGGSVATGDWDGDGRAELIVGAWRAIPQATAVVGEGVARGVVSVWSNTPSAGPRTGATATFPGPTSTSELGRSVADVGDWDGDGRTDLAIGAPAREGRDGAVYVVSGRDLSSGDLGNALMTMHGRVDQRLGLGLASRVDLDGDGRYELIAAGADLDTPYTTLGVVYGGGAAGARVWADVDVALTHACGPATWRTCLGASWEPIGASEPFATGLGAAADLDGDGLLDLVLSDPSDDAGGVEAGRVWVLWGRTVPYAGAATLEGTATAVATGISEDERLGSAAAALPDDDRDGAGELWFVRGSSGDAFHVAGGPNLKSGAVDVLSDAVATYVVPGADVTRVIAGADLTGDGLPDPVFAFANEGRGVVRIGRSGARGMFDHFDGPGSFVGGDDESSFGASLAAGDVDGDGGVDLVIGDPDAFAADGAAYVFIGR